MKKQQIAIGSTYAVKVSGMVQPVKVYAKHPAGGWYATNLRTGRDVRIRTAARLRYEVQR